MYYKIIVNNSNISSLYHILKNISKFYIIINPTISLNYYVIYLIIDNIDNLHLLHKYKIKGFFYNKLIYKIYYTYLKNFTKINHFIFIDYIFYNLLNVKIYNKLSLDSYLNLFKLTKILQLQIFNFINFINSKIILLVHQNINYLNFISNFIFNYKPNSMILYNINLSIESQYNDFKLKLNNSNIKKLKYIIIHIIHPYRNDNIINESINLFYNKMIIYGYNIFKTIKKKVNIMILSNYNYLYHNYNTYFNTYTFSKILI